MKAKVNLPNIIAYLVGNVRYRLYYSSFKYLIRKHVREQIDYRIKFMKKECYVNGTCIICGCATTALQMSNKACDSPCYPPMLNSWEWGRFKAGCYYEYKGYYFHKGYESEEGEGLHLNWTRNKPNFLNIIN